MPRKSALEEILEGCFKTPIVGLIASLIFVIVGFYLSNKSAPPGTAVALTVPFSRMLGNLMYLLAVLALLASALGYVVSSFKKKKRNSFFAQKETLADIKGLTWKEFEQFVGRLFEKMGYRVEVTGGLKDNGVDLVLAKDGKSHVVQCKKYRERRATLSMVRDFYGAKASKGNREKGYFVTTGDATLEAKKFAEENSIEVIDGPRLMEYLSLVDVAMPRTKPVSQVETGTSKRYYCSKCRKTITEKAAKFCWDNPKRFGGKAYCFDCQKTFPK